jgi:hypothetical protein
MQEGSFALVLSLLLCSFTVPGESALLRKTEDSRLQVEEEGSENDREYAELMQAAKKLQAFCQALADDGVNGTGEPKRGVTGIASDSIADPHCTQGVVSPDFKVCCAKGCGSCGDHKLCDNPGKYNEVTGKLVDQCCYTLVKKGAPSCDKDHPPCVLSPEYKETLKKWKQDLPNRHAMQDCNKAIPKARMSHDNAMEKGEFLAQLYLNGETKYKDAERIADDVAHKCDDMIKAGDDKKAEYEAKAKKATAGDKEVNPLTGESQLSDWESEAEGGSSEAAFYQEIQNNAIVIVKAAKEGLVKVAELRAEAQKVRDVGPLQQRLDALIKDAEYWYQEALKLWQQWKDSSKDYDCGNPPPVANAESVCTDGNTKFSTNCAVKCAAGYNGNGTSNHLRCEKIGKFGQQLAGEWTGMATCAGVQCGLPPKIEHSKTVETVIRYPEVSTYNCIEGFFTPGGNTTFNADCNQKGFFDINMSHVCKAVHCGKAPQLVGTYPVEGDFNYAEEANYSCLEGYTLDSLPGGRTYFHTVCQKTGKFSHGNMGCQKVRCGPVPHIAHAKVTSQTTEDEADQHYGDEAKFECEPGYTMNTDVAGPTTFTLSCHADGEFSLLGSTGDNPMHQPRCKAICIGEPPAVEHGMLMRSPMCYGDSCEVSAEDGYSTSGNPDKGLVFDITVTTDGHFAGVEQFEPIKCGPPPPAEKASTLVETAVYGDVVSYKCEKGYSTDASKNKGAMGFSIACQEDGTFTPLPLSGGCVMINNCLGHNCGPHGVCANHLMNYTCKCDSGYGMTWHKGAQQLVCGNIDNCGPEACGVGKCVDGVNSYTCDCPTGYKQVDEPTAGNIVEHTCQAVCCGTPDEVENALVVPEVMASTKAMYLQVVQYNCEPGYTTDGKVGGANSFSITCEATKKFEGMKACEPISCGAVPTVKNAGKTASSATFGEAVEFECKTGFTLDGTADGESSFSITCGLGGVYSDPQECKRVSCGEAPDSTHASHEAKTFYYEDTVEYSCFAGFTTNGKKDGPTTFSSTCKDDGNYSKLEQCLPKVCGEFTADTFRWGYFQDEGEIVYPTSTEITCYDGFTIDGQPAGNNSFTVSCLASGDFEKYDAHMCKPIVCGMPPVVGNTTAIKITGGEVASGGSPESPGEVIGTSGDPCTPCYNSLHTGICVTFPDTDNYCYGPDGNGYCQDGGPDGDFPITTCKPKVTKHVMVYGDHVTYQCDVGFTVGGEQGAPMTYEVGCGSSGFSTPTPDMLCRNVNDCEGHTCGPKGTCVDLIGPAPAYTCNCDYGYVIKEDADGEKHCGNKDDCKGVSCGVGVCKDLIGTYTCTCPGGYYTGIDAATGKKSCLPVVCSADIPVVKYAESRISGSFIQISGKVRASPVVFPTTLIYTCDVGYSVDGTPVEGRSQFKAQCKADGALHGLATCQKVTCGTPPVHEHTSLVSPDSDHHSVDYEEEAKYECDSGYTITGSTGGATEFTQSCQSSGHLTDAKVCQPVVCGKPPSHGNSKASIEGEIHFGQVLTYECGVGYTLDGSADGANEFTVSCGADGEFGSSDVSCSPIAIDIPEFENGKLFKYAGVETTDDFKPVVATYPDTFTYKCKSGYTLNGKASGATTVSTAVSFDGELIPALPSGCQPITYSIRGTAQNAPDASYLAGVQVIIEGTDYTATTDGSGHFSFPSVPAGNHTFKYTLSGFINGEKSIVISADISVGGAADISMSPVLCANCWRAVLKWGYTPRDLDTYGRWGSYKTCWYQTTQNDGTINMHLEHDDTNHYGPETLHIEGVGSCTAGAQYCDINYLINDYTQTGLMGKTPLVSPDASISPGGISNEISVTLYNGDRIAGHWDISDCESSVNEDRLWWHVFTIDGSNGQVKWNCNMGASPPTPTMEGENQYLMLHDNRTMHHDSDAAKHKSTHTMPQSSKSTKDAKGKFL